MRRGVPGGPECVSPARRVRMRPLTRRLTPLGSPTHFYSTSQVVVPVASRGPVVANRGQAFQ